MPRIDAFSFSMFSFLLILPGAGGDGTALMFVLCEVNADSFLSSLPIMIEPYKYWSLSSSALFSFKSA